MRLAIECYGHFHETRVLDLDTGQQISVCSLKYEIGAGQPPVITLTIPYTAVKELHLEGEVVDLTVKSPESMLSIGGQVQAATDEFKAAIETTDKHRILAAATKLRDLHRQQIEELQPIVDS